MTTPALPIQETDAELGVANGANDSAGKVLGTGYQPGKSLTLVRNPNWSASTDFRPAYLNQINVSIGGDANVIGRQVLEGSGMVQSDAPAAPIVKLAVQQHPSQLVISSGGGAGDRYIAINNSDGPFKNVNLRKALWAATDREALNRLRGGKTVADLMTHFLWNGIAGFEEAGGYTGPKFDYNEHGEGDMQVAEKYMKLAGYPSGKYTGSETLQVVGDPFSHGFFPFVIECRLHLHFVGNLNFFRPQPDERDRAGGSIFREGPP